MSSPMRLGDYRRRHPHRQRPSSTAATGGSTSSGESDASAVITIATMAYQPEEAVSPPRSSAPPYGPHRASHEGSSAA
jgi:hypothetical protein